MRTRIERRSEAGFSLIELLVTMVIMAEILIAVLILFDSSNRIARAQTQLAELQQSLRVGQSEVVRYARMAGLGGLPITRLNPDHTPDGSNTNYGMPGAFPRSGYAVSLINDVAPGSDIITITHAGSSETADGEVLEDSDVLILRGVFSTPIYYVDPRIDIEEEWCSADPCDLMDATDRLVVVPERIRIAGDTWEDYPQDISLLGERLEAARTASDNDHKSVALIFRDTLNPNAYAIMEFDHGNTTQAMLVPADCPDPPATAVGTPQCIQFRVKLNPDNTPGDAYHDLSTGTLLETAKGGVRVEDAGGDTVVFPKRIGSIGLLEEYRLFVRREYEVPGLDTTRLAPVLSRASFLPGTDIQLDRVDLADNVIDLQIAVGVDSDADGAVTEDLTGNKDEILFNHLNDTVSSVSPYNYREPLADSAAAFTWYDVDNLEYHFLRINTLAQSRLPSFDFLTAAIGNIEDNNRGNTVTTGTIRYRDETRYRRRWLQTVVELRNLL